MKPKRCNHPECNCMKHSKAVEKGLNHIFGESYEELDYLDGVSRGVIKKALRITEQEAKREVFTQIEFIDNEMRKSNDLFRLHNDEIIDELLKRLKHLNEERG